MFLSILRSCNVLDFPRSVQVYVPYGTIHKVRTLVPFMEMSQNFLIFNSKENHNISENCQENRKKHRKITLEFTKSQNSRKVTKITIILYTSANDTPLDNLHTKYLLKKF